MLRFFGPLSGSLRPSVLAAALCGLAACTGGPDFRTPVVAPPESYAAPGTGTSATAPMDRWWTSFGDATLTDLVERALADNPDLATAEARVRQARALARASGAAFYPTVNASGRVSRDKLSVNGENLALIPFTPKTTEFTDYRLGFDTAWEIDLAGRTRRDVEAAVARFGSAAESRNDARVVVAAEVSRAYIEYQVAAARLALARRNAAAADDSLRLVATQEHAGVASATDRGRIEADREAAAAVIPALESARDGALFRLVALTAQDRSAVLARLAGSAGVPVVPAAVPVGLPSELLRRRPDVRRAERDLAAATAEVGSAVAAQFPRLSLVGDFGWDSVRSGDLTNAASRYWNLVPQLTVPVFAGGRLRRQVESAEAARDAATASYRSTVLRAFADTETALVQFAAERSRNANLTAAAAALDGNLGHERRRFNVGDASMLEVLAADRSAAQAEDQRVAGAGQLALDYVALGKALGGGWQDSPGR